MYMLTYTYHGYTYCGYTRRSASDDIVDFEAFHCQADAQDTAYLADKAGQGEWQRPRLLGVEHTLTYYAAGVEHIMSMTKSMDMHVHEHLSCCC